MRVLDHVWLCPDCTLAAVNDDYTGLDYHYNPEEAEQRAERIKDGLRELGPGLALADGRDEFSRAHCECCGDQLAGERQRFALLGEEVTR